MKRVWISLLLVALIAPSVGLTDSGLSSETFAGLELRNLGPALMSGRIADIAIDPTDQSG